MAVNASFHYALPFIVKRILIIRLYLLLKKKERAIKFSDCKGKAKNPFPQGFRQIVGWFQTNRRTFPTIGRTKRHVVGQITQLLALNFKIMIAKHTIKLHFVLWF